MNLIGRRDLSQGSGLPTYREPLIGLGRENSNRGRTGPMYRELGAEPKSN